MDNETRQLILGKLEESNLRGFTIGQMSDLLNLTEQMVGEEADRMVEDGLLQKVADDIYLIIAKSAREPDQIPSVVPSLRNAGSVRIPMEPTAGSSTMPRKSARDYPPLPPEADN